MSSDSKKADLPQFNLSASGEKINNGMAEPTAAEFSEAKTGIEDQENVELKKALDELFTDQFMDAHKWNRIEATIRSYNHLMSARDIAMLTKRCAKTFQSGLFNKDVATSLLNCLAPELFARIATFSSGQLSSISWAFLTVNADSPKLMDAIAKEVCNKITRFSSEEIAEIAFTFATAKIDEPELFKAIVDETSYKLSEFNSQELTNTAWALATARIDAPELFAAIAAEASKMLTQLNCGKLAKIAWAFATANIKATEFFNAIAKEAGNKFVRFNNQDLATITWAFEVANVYAPEFINKAVEETLRGRKLSELPSDREELRNTLHELFGSQSISVEQLSLLQAIVESCVHLMTAKDVAKTSHRIARSFKSNILNETAASLLLTRLCPSIRVRIKSFNAQQLSNIVWAFATVGVNAPELFKEIGNEANDKVEKFSSQGLANIAWAFATANVEEPDLFKAIAKEATYKLGQFNSQELANVAWAFAAANIDVPEFFKMIARAATNRLPELNTRDLASLAWSFAIVNIDLSEFSSAIANEARKKLTQFNKKGLIVIAWAFALFDMNCQEFIDEIFHQLRQVDRDSFTPEDLSQLYVASIIFSLEVPFSVQGATGPCFQKVSFWEEEVAICLRKIGLKPRAQVTVMPYTLDFLVEYQNRKIAIECDGALYHRVGGIPHGRRLGSDVIKDKFLGKLGIACVRVLYEDWCQIEDKETFLREAIENANNAM